MDSKREDNAESSLRRMNTKIAERDLEVKDLVKDLSDGVSLLLPSSYNTA